MSNSDFLKLGVPDKMVPHFLHMMFLIHILFTIVMALNGFAKGIIAIVSFTQNYDVSVHPMYRWFYVPLIIAWYVSAAPFLCCALCCFVGCGYIIFSDKTARDGHIRYRYTDHEQIEKGHELNAFGLKAFCILMPLAIFILDLHNVGVVLFTASCYVATRDGLIISVVLYQCIASTLIWIFNLALNGVALGGYVANLVNKQTTDFFFHYFFAQSNADLLFFIVGTLFVIESWRVFFVKRSIALRLLQHTSLQEMEEGIAASKYYKQ